ncbi:MAG: 4Fe-4S binding protein [Myxococcota bacterium]|jgi:2-oxoacid:acceptor oxidoreductase delta subunit (pyruvate/2-ketoisovalerate family)|nr:4Fe-4S binding protein [Myxococcota bacterium]
MKRDICRVIGNKRPTAPTALASGLASFEETDATLTVEQAMNEARRCTAASPCTYCEVCELICPDLAITRDPRSRELLIDLDYCKGCGLCAHYCPHHAIEMIVDV